MILDQGIGFHHAQSEWLGYGWTWVSGEYEDLTVPGPYRWDALATHIPGATATGMHLPGQRAANIHNPGQAASGFTQ